MHSRRRTRRSRRCAIGSGDMPPGLPEAEISRMAPDGFDHWREMFRVVQAGEIWELRRLRDRRRPPLVPALTNASRSRPRCRSATSRRCGKSTRRRALISVRWPTRYHYCAADFAVHCAALVYSRGGSGVVPRPRHAPHLHGGCRRACRRSASRASASSWYPAAAPDRRRRGTQGDHLGAHRGGVDPTRNRKFEIHLPPADSPSLARIRVRRSRTPAFRAGVRGWLGDRVGRDAQGVSISRQPAAISLSGHIPVPRCR